MSQRSIFLDGVKGAVFPWISDFCYRFFLQCLSERAEKGDYDTERKFHYSEKGSYGTARFMDKRRMKELLDVTGIQKTEGTILGTVDGAVVSIPVASRMNRNIAVFGASGSMKSRAFVRNMIFQSVKEGKV